MGKVIVKVELLLIRIQKRLSFDLVELKKEYNIESTIKVSLGASYFILNLSTRYDYTGSESLEVL